MSRTAQLMVSIQVKLETKAKSMLAEAEMNKIIWNCAVMLIAGDMPECLLNPKE